MTGTAQGEEIGETLQATGTEGPVNLRETVAERLAAHRSRRAQGHAQLGGPLSAPLHAQREVQMRAQRHVPEEEPEAQRRRREDLRAEQRRGAGAVRDAVRARYETSQSYREFLAAEAERALAQAQAEADVAARTARAVAEAQLQLLEEMEQWTQSESSPREQAFEQVQAEVRGDLAHALADIALGARELMAEPPLLTVTEGFSAVPESLPRHPDRQPGAPALTEVSAGGLTVKLYEDLGPAKLPHVRSAHLRKDVGASIHEGSEELQELEQEIEFRRSPEFLDHVIETTPIPGNLIEFPRELIAPRKARPRLAEGPLRDEEVSAPQLRIFEVEAEQPLPETAPAEVHGDAPEWQSLSLEANRVPERSAPHTAQAHFTTEPQTASMELRLMAAIVDGAIVALALLGFLCVAALVAGPALRQIALPPLLLSGAATAAVFGLLYQMLFFTFADGTPGMLYARIGLCTFGDRNPTRKAMRRRVFATVLAACPLGLGLLWMWMDDDRLGWHDRMSRMYQRAY